MPFDEAAYQAEYRRKNAEEINAKKRAHYAANKEKMRARSASWRLANLDAVNAREFAYRQRTAAERASYNAQWRQDNPDKERKKQRDRTARVVRNGRYLRTGQDKVRQLARQHGCCFYCGDRLLPGAQTHTDHVVPLARGGKDSVGNIVYACRSCNLSKGTSTVTEWIVRVLRRVTVAA